MTAPNQWSLTYKSDYSRENWLRIWNDKKEREEAKNFSLKCKSQAYFEEGPPKGKQVKSENKDDNRELKKFRDNCKIVFLFPDLDSKKLSTGHGTKKLEKLDQKTEINEKLDLTVVQKPSNTSTDIY